jgi:hypothetical protein
MNDRYPRRAAGAAGAVPEVGFPLAGR